MKPVSSVLYDAASCLACRRLAALPRRRVATAAGSRRLQHTEANSNDGPQGPRSSAAAHLLAQAAVEDADLDPANSISQRVLESQRKDVPWQGEESIEDAVLRMLVDKYKPLRVPGTKRKIQQPSSEPLQFRTEARPETDHPGVRIYDANGNIDQSVPGYKWQPGDPPRHPWEHTFRHPANADGSPLVRAGNIVQPSAAMVAGSHHNKAARPSAADVAARVYRARDASVDYSSGSHDTAKAKVQLGQKGRKDPKLAMQASGGGFRPMPTNIRAWSSMVDERIELARQQGLFKDVKGRGKPIERDPEEGNPFIAREEFLMNRIVKRQEAAPPFVELQREMRDELNGFRLRLREAWIKRATRILSLQPLTTTIIKTSGDFRDPEWEQREKAYHETCVNAVNQLIRKHNVVAPFSVRLPFVTVENELRLCFKDCATLIQQEMERRAKNGYGNARPYSTGSRTSGRSGHTGEEEPAVRETMLSAFRRLVREVFAQKS